MPYNRWYTYTYDHIRRIADWSDLAADVEAKIIAVFSWMRQPIMSIKHSKDSVKHELFTPDSIRAALGNVRGEFDKIKNLELEDFDVHLHEKALEELCDALFPIFGSVAASKYLHFSAPRLLPMWDRKLRLSKGIEDSAFGYIRYMIEFKNELKIEKNHRAAVRQCAENAVRGWDIVCMKRR
jgi:hypothetical protein